MSDIGWLAVAFLAVAIGVGGYIASLFLRRRNVERRTAELEGPARGRDD